MRTPVWRNRHVHLLVLFAVAWLAPSLCHADEKAPRAEAREAMLDLATAVVVAPSTMATADASRPEQNAIRMLVDEVEQRTGIRWRVEQAWPVDARAIIAVGARSALAALQPALAEQIAAAPPQGAEGFLVQVAAEARPPVVLVAGNDPRGVLYGAGRLLRELDMRRGAVAIAPGFSLNTAPKVALRGHQLGYRPKVNTYDGWTPAMFEQYIRDLAVFGTNAIELMPPRSDDAPDSPHFTIPQIDMMARMAQLADDYGMAVWIWYPAMDKDYGDRKTLERALEEWGAVFARLPRIDAVFVPGGDPGHTPPRQLMKLLEKETEVLHRTHPAAQMWMSPQGFTKEWMDEFIAIMQNEQPTWLSGIVFGPQNRLGLPELRDAIPKQYPIRHYPDITHTYSCQYAVQDWDVAYKLAEDREIINPRPMAYTEIFRWSLPYTIGFLSYSEGVNDDLNKILWSALGWDPEADVYDILRQYARYFVGASTENELAHALLALERNWQGPLLTNAGVYTTLQQVQDIERAATPQMLLNWRFQQVVYRANFDAYVRCRLIRETELEDRAMEVLRRADALGAALAIDEAERILCRAELEPVGSAWRNRASEMAEALYQSIRMQLSVPRYRAIDVGRGANLDTIDKPVNNRLWLESRFAEIRALSDEGERLQKIRAIVQWTDPGPGGFYDDLGNAAQQPHLVRDLTQAFDPENRILPLLGYEDAPADRRISWFDDAETRFEAPLKMRYEHLDPRAQYTVRAVYAGDKFDAQMRLLADEAIEVHGLVAKEFPIRPVEFDIPVAATADGTLTLTWYQNPGRGSSGRGCQVAEVWLIKKAP